MRDPDRDDESSTDIRLDNWPVERRGGHEDLTIERERANREADATEKLAEEYDEEVADDEVEWIGFLEGDAAGHPYLYSPRESAVYEGELDESEERVILREADRRDVEEESLGEHIEEIGDEHGWTWLSDFAQEYLEDEPKDEPDQPSAVLRDSEFDQRAVAESDPYDLAFYGSYTFEDESGQVRIVERYFNVYLDAETEDLDRIEVSERYLVAEEPDAERSAGDAELVDENERALDLDLDLDEFGAEGTLESRLEEWHKSQLRPPSED